MVQPRNAHGMKNWRNHIESHPDILYGKPVIRGTRIPVDLLLEKLSEGESADQLLEAYPRLTREGIFAALAFAADTIKSEVVWPLAS
ncbi:MAG: DUF433 domain-containing protein [Bacteroidia bacterium]|nr:DUF433 domain-containing protein [Bacteroidia bacterium]